MPPDIFPDPADPFRPQLKPEPIHAAIVFFWVMLAFALAGGFALAVVIFGWLAGTAP